MTLRKATRQKSKIRLGLSAVAGGGKTYSALLIASGMTSWDKIALIDTENGSGDLYENLGAYNVLPIEAPYTPEKYIQAIKTCEDAGMEVIIIDSITHEWDGEGGCLEIQAKLGGRYQDWAKVTPRHVAFIQAILKSKCHVITTVRRKQDYEMTNEGNRIAVKKVGLKEVTREGFEYELTANLEIELNHYASASKDRTGLFLDKPSFIPSPETGKAILNWCNSGVAPLPKEDTRPLLTDDAFNKYIDRIKLGEIDLFDKIKGHYNLNSDQLDTLMDAVMYASEPKEGIV